MKKQFYLFIGKKIHVGLPNPVTGLKNYSGRVVKFKTGYDRSFYIIGNIDKNDKQQILVAGGKNKIRSCCLGSTLDEFNKMMDTIPTLIKKDGKWVEEKDD